MTDLPIGTVTFLLTDVEGSTRLWEQHPSELRGALARHDQLVQGHVERHGGLLVKPRGEGDSHFAVFAKASDALSAARCLQLALQAEPFPVPLRVRMALHTGEADLRDGDYFGSAVNRCARLRAIAHGGQVLLSQATYDLVRDALPEGASLKDLGEQRLRDLTRSEPVLQLCHPDLPADFPALHTLDTYPNNLPLQLTSFVGREREMAEVRRLLGTTRLLTLTGTGGCGKTRLAYRVAADVLDENADGVWVVELASVASPELVPQTAAAALGLREQPGQPILTTLLGNLRSRHVLLVLDNCEHLLDACAVLADALLRGCSRLRVLATSREPLGIAGETSYRVPSLSLPDPRQLPPLERLTQYEAARLFVDRALAVDPSFAVTDENATAIAQVCWRLDGIPLAIELAAARLRALSANELARRLDDRFRLLTGGSRTALRRQQTLRAAIDWSYDLLSEPERVLLRRLAVFAGGWTLEAAEEVCARGEVEPTEAIDLVLRLVDRSLVVADTAFEPTRYRLLETVRQYAQERLNESGEVETLRMRHADYYVRLAEREQPTGKTLGERAAWVNRLEAEHRNLQTVIAWSLESGEAEAGLRASIAMATWHYGNMRGFSVGEREQIERLLSLPAAATRDSMRIRGLGAACGLALHSGDSETILRNGQEWLTIARELGDKGEAAKAIFALGWGAVNRGALIEARSCFEEGLALALEVQDQRRIAWMLSSLGRVSHLEGDQIRAEAFIEESLVIARRLGEPLQLAAILTSMGRVRLSQSDYHRAREAFTEALRLARGLGHQRRVASSLAGLAGVAAAQAEPGRAATLSGAAQAVLGQLSWVLDPDERGEAVDSETAVRAALDPEAVAAAWAEGQAMTLDEAVEYALEAEA